MVTMETELSKFEKYMRMANYLTVAQIFLQDNFLLERELTFDDVKRACLVIGVPGRASACHIHTSAIWLKNTTKT